MSELDAVREYEEWAPKMHRKIPDAAIAALKKDRDYYREHYETVFEHRNKAETELAGLRAAYDGCVERELAWMARADKAKAEVARWKRSSQKYMKEVAHLRGLLNEAEGAETDPDAYIRSHFDGSVLELEAELARLTWMLDVATENEIDQEAWLADLAARYEERET